MQEDILIQISTHIKDRRREKGITVQELADRAQVSKGLISQIENSRTIPSLIVLIQIIKALEIDINIFFKDIQLKTGYSPVIVRRKEDYQPFEKENAVGFKYHRIFAGSIKNSTVDMVILELEPESKRPMVVTEAYEFKYMLTGEIEYHFKNEIITLRQGDSMLFDGRIPHTPKNITVTTAAMLVTYFFEEVK